MKTQYLNATNYKSKSSTLGSLSKCSIKSSTGAQLVQEPGQKAHPIEHWIPAFLHPQRLPHPVEHRQKILFKIASGATGSVVVSGIKEPSSPLPHLQSVGFRVELLSHHSWIWNSKP